MSVRSDGPRASCGRVSLAAAITAIAPRTIAPAHHALALPAAAIGSWLPATVGPGAASRARVWRKAHLPAARAGPAVRCVMVISGLVVTLADGARPEALGDLLAPAQVEWGAASGRRHPLVIESQSQFEAMALHEALGASRFVEFVDVTYIAEDG